VSGRSAVSVSTIQVAPPGSQETRMSTWSKEKEKAEKLLGDKAKIPEISPAIKKAYEAYSKLEDEFKTVREACEDKLLDMKNGIGAVKNAMEQFIDKVESLILDSIRKTRMRQENTAG
jgi:predicted transcriptional regulator